MLSGEEAGGTFLIDQGRLVANDIKGPGRWLMEEAPGQVIPELLQFLN